MVYVEDGGFVIPGQEICVAEEYLPGLNVRNTKDNIIVSMRLGFVKYNKDKRTVDVHLVKTVENLNLGDKVLAIVKEVQEKIAIVEILAVNMKPIRHKRVAVILPTLKIKQDISEYIGVGDLIIAEIVTLFSGVIGLSIWRSGLGTVVPICSKCGRPLRKKDKILICIKCGNKEKRKLANYDLAVLERWILNKSVPG